MDREALQIVAGWFAIGLLVGYVLLPLLNRIECRSLVDAVRTLLCLLGTMSLFSVLTGSVDLMRVACVGLAGGLCGSLLRGHGIGFGKSNGPGSPSQKGPGSFV
jgi:hypothetical protein